MDVAKWTSPRAQSDVTVLVLFLQHNNKDDLKQHPKLTKHILPKPDFDESSWVHLP